MSQWENRICLVQNSWLIDVLQLQKKNLMTDSWRTYDILMPILSIFIYLHCHGFLPYLSLSTPWTNSFRRTLYWQLLCQRGSAGLSVAFLWALSAFGEMVLTFSCFQNTFLSGHHKLLSDDHQHYCFYRPEIALQYSLSSLPAYPILLVLSHHGDCF